jgi:hypothetical protein
MSAIRVFAYETEAAENVAHRKWSFVPRQLVGVWSKGQE